jgi:glyoxylate/hydroxypyruvate reductase A
MSRPALLFAGADERAGPWIEAFRRKAPEIDFVVDAPDMDLSSFRYCMAWKPRSAIWAAMPDLRAVFSLGAGVDRLLSDPALPKAVPIIRMVEPGLTHGMVEYVLWQCLFHHRRMWELQEAQAAGQWRPHVYPTAKERVIGIMGLGEMGLACARKLIEFDFTLKGWSRTAKAEPGLASFAGWDQLAPFLRDVQILVCLLPLTKETAGILNARTFDALAPGACLINAARGGHLNEADLLVAMTSGQIAAATLDVFQTEPLPKDHPFWSQSRLFITPHNASLTDPEGAARHVSAQIERMESGHPPEHAVDRLRGY